MSIVTHGEMIEAMRSDSYVARPGATLNDIIAAFTRTLAVTLAAGDTVDVRGLGRFAVVDERIAFRAAAPLRRIVLGEADA